MPSFTSRRFQQAISGFALVFSTTWLLHGPLLRLPYFWDEAGYYVPAAYDIFRTGQLIPTTTLSNAHPPLVMLWLAMWWKLSNFTPAVTRTAMLLVAAFGLYGVFKLADRLTNWKVAAVSVTLTALYSVMFAQSSLAQLDMPVMAVAIWGLYYYLKGRRIPAIFTFAVAAMVKETALIFPLTIFFLELLSPIIGRFRGWKLSSHPRRVTETLAMLLSAIPLGLWYAYHFHKTGYIFGNPEYVRYNIGATLSPLRFVIALGMRLWHILGYMNMFVLTAAAFVISREPALRENSSERTGVDRSVQLLFGALILAHAVAFAAVGGAALARYVLPVIPLVVILSVAALYRHSSNWIAWCGLAGAAFVLALLINPPWRIAPEDNLAYSDFVHLHAGAAAYLQKEHPGGVVLTAWPGSDELNRPFVGYVRKPMTVVRVENFSAPQMIAAAQQRDLFDFVYVFNTKYDPPRNLLSRLRVWNRLQERFFDYHQDLGPEQIALMMQGKIVWQQQRGGQWAAIIALDHVQNARLTRNPSAAATQLAFSPF